MRKRAKDGRFSFEGKWFKKQCLHCGKKFETRYATFCSKNCYSLWKRGRFTGEKSPRWNGGRIVDAKDGYILIYRPDHPFCRKRDKYVLEHRIVCEKALGRYLTKKEIPHHINDDKTDNRPENLYLFPDKSSHTTYHLLLRSGKVTKIISSNLPK